MQLLTDLERAELLADTDDHEARWILHHLMGTQPEAFDEVMRSWRKALEKQDRTVTEMVASLDRLLDARGS